MNFCRTLSIRRQVMLWALAALAIPMQLQAGKVSLQWNQSADPGVTGYRLRVVQVSTGSASVINAGNTNVTIIDNLLEGQSYMISVTAYTAAGIESDPSNSVNYTVPTFSGPTYALQFGKFNHGSANYSPHGTMSSIGDALPAGSVVTLTAVPASGYICSGWSVNGSIVQRNPTSVTMNQNTLVTPIIKKRNGGGGSTADPAQVSFQLSGLAGGSISISIGPEMGAWILEGTANFTTWNPVASGLTSDALTVPATEPYAFYRVRQAQLTPF